MTSWVERPTIDLDLDVPLERRLEAVPEDVIAGGRRLLDAIMAEVPGAARLVADYVRARTQGRFHDELRAFADRAGVGWRTVMVANVTYDLALMMMGCSTVALPTAEGPIVARNMDWWPEAVLAQTSYLFRYHREGDLTFANAGWPGAIGVVTGLSGRGFAVVLNAVSCPEGCDWTGYPTLLHIRRVLEDADGFDTALTMLKDQHLAAPCLLTLIGAENPQRVVIERTPKRHALRWAKPDRPLYTTNDYRLLHETVAGDGDDNARTSCARYDALGKFFEGDEPGQCVDDSRLLYVLTDPEVMQEITAQHIIMHPRSGAIRLYVPRRLV